MKDLKNKAIESLREQFKTADEMGKIIINNCLLPQINNDPVFSERIIVEKKTVKDMINHITSWVRKSKNHSPSHNVIFSLAIHYYQEDDPGYIEELHKEDSIEFGNIEKEFNTPIIKFITGTIIQEIVKEVEKETKKPISQKTKKTVIEKLKESGQQTLF